MAIFDPGSENARRQEELFRATGAVTAAYNPGGSTVTYPTPLPVSASPTGTTGGFGPGEVAYPGFTYTPINVPTYTNPYEYTAYSGYDPMPALEDYGTQQRKDLAQYWKNATNTGMQALRDRGLSSTTIAPSVRAGYTRQKSDSMADFGQDIAKTKADYAMKYADAKNAWEQYQQSLEEQYWQATNQANLSAWGTGAALTTQQETAANQAQIQWQQSQQQLAYNYYMAEQAAQQAAANLAYQYYNTGANIGLGYYNANLSHNNSYASQPSNEAAMFAQQAQINNAAFAMNPYNYGYSYFG